MPHLNIPTEFTVSPKLYGELINQDRTFKVLFAAIACCHIRDQFFMDDLEALCRSIRSIELHRKVTRIPLQDFLVVVSKSKIGRAYGRKEVTVPQLLLNPNCAQCGVPRYYRTTRKVQKMDIVWWASVWELLATGVKFKLKGVDDAHDTTGGP